eukprot:TRINITY_DN2757_c0_g1_i18.p1 TRINITY_DN2757_c0_g1~~TRINITY_DN2757_c0_g1_i18.p1  ORF type:complete len:433 (-),score=87.92 TRINITY_DN2757_c0_g1_i18:1321-2619(-)
MSNLSLVLHYVNDLVSLPVGICVTDVYKGKPSAVLGLLRTIRDRLDIEYALSKMPKHERSAFLIKELITTEQVYVSKLFLVIETLMTPARLSRPAMLSRGEVDAVFGNWKDIAFKHEAFLDCLRGAFPFKKIATYLDTSILFKLLDGLMSWIKPVYTTYILNYDASIPFCASLRKSNQRFDSLVARFEEAQAMDLYSFLILPVQRVPRYLLLVRELTRCTPQAEQLRACVAKFDAILHTVNERKRALDNTRKVRAIEASIHGTFASIGNQCYLREGFLGILGADEEDETRSYFFLFSDRLMLTRHIPNVSPCKDFKFDAVFWLKDADEVTDEMENEEAGAEDEGEGEDATESAASTSTTAPSDVAAVAVTDYLPDAAAGSEPPEHETEGDERACMFGIIMKDFVLGLVAESEQSKLEWMEDLSSAIQKLKGK